MQADTQEPSTVTNISSGRAVMRYSPGNTLIIHMDVDESKKLPPVVAVALAVESGSRRARLALLNYLSDTLFGR
jgi:hypothetical protein